MEQPHTPVTSASTQKQSSADQAIAAHDAIILELQRPEILHPHHMYQRDVLKWGFSLTGSTSSFGIYLRDGKLIERAPLSRMHVSDLHITYGLRTFNIPQIPHPVRKPHYDPSPPWEDLELEASKFGIVSQYSVLINISGNSDRDKKPFKIQLDTGSSTCWVFGEEIDVETSALRKSLHTCYYPGPTARRHGEQIFQIEQHRQLVAMGTICNDTWQFPTRDGARLDLCVNFGVAQQVEAFLSLSRLDGVLGLSIFPTNRETSSPTEPDHFLTLLHARGLITNFIFCMCLHRQGRSFLSLGCIPEEIPKPRHWIPLIPGASKWIIPCHAIGWGVSPTHDQFEDMTFSSPIQALIDSGTTYCFFSDEVLVFVYTRLQGRPDRNGYMIPSRRPAGMEVQRIWINLGGEWMLWPRESLYGNAVKGPWVSDDAWFDGLLKSQGDDFPFFILGAAFFEEQYVYFDADPSAPKVAFEHRLPEVKLKTEPIILYTEPIHPRHQQF